MTAEGERDKGRPDQQAGATPKRKTGCGNLFLTDCSQSDYPEIFLKLGKTGGCPAAFLQALAKVSSLALRAGVTRSELVRIWKGIGCPNPAWDGPTQVLSCPDAVAQMLEGEEQIWTNQESRRNST